MRGRPIVGLSRSLWHVLVIPEDSFPAASGGGEMEERLRRLQAVTDVALSRLDVDELLPELLDRVRDLLTTDTAAILLLDEAGQFLVATAARGLEEEVRQGSRVPLGLGFAGRIAARRGPVIVEDVNPTTVVNPVLLHKGIRSMLGVPLLAEGRVLGVLHVGTLKQRRFTDEDVELLEQVADRASQAIQMGHARADRVAAAAMQRSLAPRQLPVVPGLELAARYVPGSQLGVGGDWYDVFLLPEGRLAITIGDVMGHGVRAAAVMGRLRSALRAYALEYDDPAKVLELLDRKIQYFEPGQLATVAYGLYDPETRMLRLSSAGHWPPAITGPETTTRIVDLRTDMLLGAEPDVVRHNVEIRIDPGSLLCLFTDGLIERRGQDFEISFEALRRALHSDVASAEQACADIMTDLIGSGRAADDVALLMLRGLDD